MDRVVLFSGGIGSWAAARRVIAEHPGRIVLLFTDTLCEDQDLYRFLIEGAASILPPTDRTAVALLCERAMELPEADIANADQRKKIIPDIAADAMAVLPHLVWDIEGRTVWDVFNDSRFLGNTRADLCSRILKRERSRKWITENCTADDTTIYVGVDWTEEHRARAFARAWMPWCVRAPLCEPPYKTKDAFFEELKALGLKPPRLYAQGFAHNNCGGCCVKAGRGAWALTLNKHRDRYLDWEERERRIREVLGDVAILRDRTDGTTDPMTLEEWRKRVECGNYDQMDMLSIGGCGCFTDVEEVDVDLFAGLTK